MELEEKCHEIENSKSALREINSDSCCFSDKFALKTRTRRKQCLCTLCIQADLTKYPSAGNPFDCQTPLASHFKKIDLENYVNETVIFCNDIRSSFRPSYTPYYEVQFACSGDFSGMQSGKRLWDSLDHASEESDESDGDSSEYPDLHFQTKSLPSFKTDDRIRNMVQTFEQQYCSKLRLGLQYSEFTFPEHSEAEQSHQDWRTNFTGLGCHQNRSLTFLAMDSILFPAIAESAGMNLSLVTHKTLAFILDQSNENVFLLHHEVPRNDAEPEIQISKREIYEFVRNFTKGSLTRFLRVDRSGISVSGGCLPGKRGVVCVPELASDTFSAVVMNPHSDVVVFYYTQWCGFCSSVSHIYLSVARFFSGIDGIVFTRINLDRNDLPVKWTVDRFPSIIFFPAHR